jgi:hypothetical protein
MARVSDGEREAFAPPFRALHPRARAGVGMLLGAVSIGSVRCSGLFLGEALGMFAGLLGGAVAISAGAWLWTRAQGAAAGG